MGRGAGIAGVVAALVLLAPACGGSPAPGGPAPLLFAALQARDTPDAMGWNTVVIAGLDGRIRAEASFTPFAPVYVGCAGPVLPPQAYVAAGRVWFSDGTGVIRSLAPDGKVASATRLPFTNSQQMLSFAVSPDGKRVLGTVFTVPPRPNPEPDCMNRYTPAGDYTLDVYAANVGDSAHLLYRQSLGTAQNAGWKVMAFVGWDAAGPLGTYPTLWATQGGGPTRYFGVPVRIDAATGTVTHDVADVDACRVFDIARSGDYLCQVISTDALSVRRPDGSEIWQVRPKEAGLLLACVSPDEQRIVGLGLPEVMGRDGSVTRIANLDVWGWLDSKTVIGGGAAYSHLAYISLSAPDRVVDLGFFGQFIGTLT